MAKIEVSVLDVSDEVIARYDALSRKYGQSREFFMTNALETSIDRLELEFEILQDSKDVASGKLKTYSSKEVGELLGFEG